MGRNCKDCKNFFICKVNKESLHIPYGGCLAFDSVKKHDFVLIHKRLESGSYSIVTFGNDFLQLLLMKNDLPDFLKKNHEFYVVSNRPRSRVTSIVDDIKDGCLLNICKNVAYSLSRAENSLLKKKYSRSKFCFERVKSMIANACYILENY